MNTTPASARRMPRTYDAGATRAFDSVPEREVSTPEDNYEDLPRSPGLGVKVGAALLGAATVAALGPLGGVIVGLLQPNTDDESILSGAVMGAIPVLGPIAGALGGWGAAD
jgi:hypothetical protein